MTGDGVEEIALGDGNRPAYLFDGKSGLLVRRLMDPEGPPAGSSFGEGLASNVGPGDVDRDGIRDVLIAAPLRDVGSAAHAGRLYLLSGKDGSLIRALEDPNPERYAAFGYHHASAGDINDDGTPDVVAMRPPFQFVSPNPLVVPPAAAYVLDGQTGAALVQLPGAGPSGPRNSLASPGDVNGDGYPDYFIGGGGRVVVALSCDPAGGCPLPPNPPATPRRLTRPRPRPRGPLTRPSPS